MDNARSKRILLIEDDAALAEIYEKKCVLEGFEVTIAQDGNEGLATALADKPDIILLDILMPKMDGLTLLKKLRDDPWGENVAVIILTNLNANDNIIQEVIENRPAYYLMKTSAAPGDVVDKIKEVLKIA